MRKGLFAFILCAAMVTALLPLSPGATAEDTENLIYSFTFEDEAAHGDLFTPTTNIRLVWANAPGIGHGDDHALRVEHFGASYTSSDNAVRLTLPAALPAGGVYRIVVWAFVPSDENEGKRTLTGPGFVINEDYPGAQGVVKFPPEFGTIAMDEWKGIDVTLPVAPWDIELLDFRFVINEADRHPDVWYWDNIEIYQIGELADMRVPEWDPEIPSLAGAYGDYFQVGNILDPHNIRDRANALMFRGSFNTVTAENAMKPLYISPEPGLFNLGGAETLVNWAKEFDISVHGHTLVWHEQSPDWLTKASNGSALTRDAARKNMEAFITGYAGHFAGQVASWDVVNEAFENSVNTGSSWKEGLRRNSPWYAAYANGMNTAAGEHPSDYIYDAFVFTRAAAPDAVLFYNDFNEEEQGKREAMAKMAEEFNERWASDPRNTEPGRLLIEGIGMQAHYWVDSLNPADVRASIERFIQAGLRIRVTELDIPFGTWGTFRSRTSEPTEIELITQANLYASLFRIYTEYADHIDAVTIWGRSDDQSWRAEGYPLLFNWLLEPKPSFWFVLEIVDPGALDRYLGETVEPGTDPDPDPPSTPAPDPPAPPPATEPAPARPPADDSGFPWWGVALILLGGGVIAGVVVVLMKKGKNG